MLLEAVLNYVIELAYFKTVSYVVPYFIRIFARNTQKKH
jgi:hypothetical protein